MSESTGFEAMLGLGDVAGATTKLMTGGNAPEIKRRDCRRCGPVTDRSLTVTGQSLSALRPDASSRESADPVGQPSKALTVPRALVVISFDIDGTMEFGDPAGPVSALIARELVDRGCILGVASDWAVSCQAPEWARHGISPRFVGGKHHLPAVKSRFTADRYVHVGDTAVDEYYARLAGFTFLHADQLPNPVSADAIHFA